MTVCVFAGPSLPRRERPENPKISWLPPAKHGDVHRVVELLQPRAIGIIDGYFRWAPSVRHQEILWALDRGVHVLGAASMGALRAAELAPFGMRGVGKIFRAYCAGVLDASPETAFEDDDEVAVIHGPPETDYVAASEAMVNIRYTLAEAEVAGLVSATTRLRLVAIAKTLHFPERSYAHLLSLARDCEIPAGELAALTAWLPEGRRDQKLADALAMVEAITTLPADTLPFRPRFRFERTTLWTTGFEAPYRAPHGDEERAVLAEARLDGSWATLSTHALNSLAPKPTEPGSAPLVTRLSERQSVAAVEAAFEQARQADALERLSIEIPRAVLERQVLAHLRASGDYAALVARANDKDARLAAQRDLPHIDDLPGYKALELQMWYFGKRGGDIPDDMQAYLHAMGYRNEAELNASLLREYAYQRMMAHNADSHDTVEHSG